MPIYSLTKQMLGLALGMADTDEPTVDENQLRSLHVRLEQMFREVADPEPAIGVLHAEDLKKLADFHPSWRSRAKLVKTSPAQFNAKDGLPDEVLRQLNTAPIWLVRQLKATKAFCLCHSPFLNVAKTGRKGFSLTVWLRCVLLPEEVE